MFAQILHSPRFVELPLTSQLECWRDFAELAIANGDPSQLQQAVNAHQKGSALFSPESAIAHFQLLLDAELLYIHGDLIGANQLFSQLAKLPRTREHSSLDPIRTRAQTQLSALSVKK